MVIELDREIISNFVSEFSDKNHLIYSDSKHGGELNAVYTLVERIQANVTYLNCLELKSTAEPLDITFAYDFVNFIFWSSSMLECINKLEKIFPIRIDDSKNIFFLSARRYKKDFLNMLREKKDQNLENKQNVKFDDTFFRYIRSICSVHPSSTSTNKKKRHKPFIQSDEELCSCVLYDNDKSTKTDLEPHSDVVLYVYSAKKGCKRKIYLSIKEFFTYVNNRYERINLLLESFMGRVDEAIKIYKETSIKEPKDFDCYDDYLSNLSVEAKKRFNDDWLLKDASNMLTTSMINEKCIKYYNALKFAINKYHQILQVMNKKFYLDCSKILLFKLIDLDFCFDSRSIQSYRYLRARRLSDDDYSSPAHSRSCARALYKDVLTEYITIKDDDFNKLENKQLLALINTGLYFYSLNNDTDFNKLIPESEDYRDSIY